VHANGGHGNESIKAHPEELERIVSIVDEALC